MWIAVLLFVLGYALIFGSAHALGSTHKPEPASLIASAKTTG